MNTLHTLFEGISEKIKADIDAIPREQLEQADMEALACSFVDRYTVEGATLGPDITIDPISPEPQLLPVQYPAVTMHVPILGSAFMLHWPGVLRQFIGVKYELKGCELLLKINVNPDSSFSSTVREKAIEVREGIEQTLAVIREQLKRFNASIKDRATWTINQRLAVFAKQRGMQEQVVNTGFALHRRNDGTERIIVPVKPKEFKILTRLDAKADPCYELSGADYDSILQLIQDMVKVFERSPSTFKKMKEEELRTILLVALNGVFKGNATAETFNGEGKTDIMIRVNDNNIFIAECLVWDGPEYLNTKLAQLFGYSAWRDSKLAIIVFNRNKGFTEVVQKMKETVAGFTNCVGPVDFNAETGCRHRFRRSRDPNKEFLLTCLAFDVPT